MKQLSLPNQRPIGPLERQFINFHNENPEVFKRIVQVCFQLRNNGVMKYSMRTIMSVLRFEWDMKTGGSNVRIVDFMLFIINHSPLFLFQKTRLMMGTFS